MITKITGASYKEMLDFGIKNLEIHSKTVNDLNVFPVPDGDTGTNMLMTMKNGYASIPADAESISDVAGGFACGVVFGARGNSGVILSQFFKGISRGLEGSDGADARAFTLALESGVECAYSSVSKPVEGTMLTVIREATETVRERLSECGSIDGLINIFLARAKQSLDNTPSLLPVLERAGVVDSGGAGIVYIFEGIKKYLDGERIDTSGAHQVEVQSIDYSAFNRQSKFEFGYCTELLIQLTDGKAEFDYDEFTSQLQSLGDSVATSFDLCKVKVHVHTKTPEKVLKYCHTFGEFLTLKIENMSVQHTQRAKKYLCGEGGDDCKFAVVAVAPDPLVQNMFVEMGVDCCILSTESPSSSEFIEAFEHTNSKEILVFPNTSNSILSAMQAASLYKGAKVTVLNCRSVAECYASLAIIDFDSEDTGEVIDAVNETVRNIYLVSIVRASKNISYGKKSIVKNDFFALAGDEILVTGDRLENVALITVRDILKHKDCSVITMFCGRNVSEQQIEVLTEEIESMGLGIELYAITTEDGIHDLTLSFE
ncbi:MAG: DAK2 domain-containing protein [Clostridia bacterium]|nr:DAK2 domain-containing protein [Clostridia bacterium]